MTEFDALLRLIRIVRSTPDPMVRARELYALQRDIERAQNARRAQ